MKLFRPGHKTLRKVDDRLGYASVGRTALAKIFPDHWTFMLGEIAFYSFMILVITGVYLVFFFDPSSTLTTYEGSDPSLHGQQVSSAFASTVRLSWDVRSGLLMRQAHHWAAHIFIGSIVLHLCRIFFTAMFRKPRELNWTIGVTMLVLAIFNAFAGYSLPDDLLSGTGLHIFYSTLEAVPFVGDWLAFLMFGDRFPGDLIIGRLYALHIFVVPAVLGVLIVAHLAILIRQKHSHFPGPGRSDANVVGSRAWPAYGLRSLALFFAVFAVVMLAGGLAQINPIWVWGDFKAPYVLSPSVADWYIAWVEGALRLFPPLEIHLWGFTIPNQFWPAVFLPGVTFALLYAWPFIDRRLTGDTEAHHVAARPRESPGRVAFGAWALTFYSLLLLAAGEELIVQWTQVPINTVRVTLRVVVIVVPLLVAVAAHRIAAVLKRTDAEGVLALTWRELFGRSSHPEQSPGDRDPAAEVGEDLARPESVPDDLAVEDELSEQPTWLRGERHEVES